MDEQRNILLAIVISLALLLAWQFLYEMPRMERQAALQQQQGVQQQEGAEAPTPGAETATPPAPTGVGPAEPAGAAEPSVSLEAALGRSPRVRIETPRIHGSVPEEGARLDEIELADYHETPDPESPEIVLLRPTGTANPYFAQFGWVTVGGAGHMALPDADTPWIADSDVLTPDNPVTFSWDNGEGLIFHRTFAIDENYMFTVTQRVENTGPSPVTLFPYGLISRTGTPDTLGYYILHEGPVGVINDSLTEIDYDDLRDEGVIEEQTIGGWLGITDKYWLVALVPDQKASVTTHFRYAGNGGQDKYQVDYLGEPQTIAAGGSTEVTSRLFAGAKEVELLDRYQETLGIPRFDLAVDFGWFYFLTKPIFFVLRFFHGLLGNFGLGILLLTVLIKLAFYPLANKSYRAMSKMKKLQPEMLKLRERFGDDRARLNQEMMALYKKEKVNPAAGCLPVLVQIPVFFALYKVLFVTIEMRHAPFYGWIKDLSAPDPLSIFTLFGLIPWDPPVFLDIGIWPLIMGLSMYLQQKINPQPPDPVQAKIFLALPVVFTFLLAHFPAGLVIYWAWNNVLSIAQQWVIMRRTEAEANAKAKA